ncbi:hypothetical protein BGZ50_004434 [Haplosporangium sp. Z 11]|nr:hypothetical protein BGZ50_004434 [Haplosporangium sp. Z 11]
MGSAHSEMVRQLQLQQGHDEYEEQHQQEQQQTVRENTAPSALLEDQQVPDFRTFTSNMDTNSSTSSMNDLEQQAMSSVVNAGSAVVPEKELVSLDDEEADDELEMSDKESLNEYETSVRDSYDELEDSDRDSLNELETRPRHYFKGTARDSFEEEAEGDSDWTNADQPSPSESLSPTSTTSSPWSLLHEPTSTSISVISSCPGTRLPVKVWTRICSFLYPSQVTRLSQVNKGLYEVVAGLYLWSWWFDRSHTSNSPLKPTLCLLPGEPASKSYMLYMCATSFVICEGCLRRCDNVTHVKGRPVMMPLPVEMPVTRDNAQGEPDNSDYEDDDNEEEEDTWTVRLCLHCRIEHYQTYPEPIPDLMNNNFLTKRVLREKYRLGQKTIQAIKHRSQEHTSNGAVVTYSEAAALKQARMAFGGDVGMDAVMHSFYQSMKVMKFRVFLYNTRRKVLLAGQKWLKPSQYHAQKTSGVASCSR